METDSRNDAVMVCLTVLFCVRDAYCQVAQKADWIFYMKSIIFLLTIWCKCDIIITEARQMIHSISRL